jgi:hypothetical protein
MTIKVAEAKTLPAELRKEWKGSEVYIVRTKDFYSAKKIQGTPSEVRQRLRAAGKFIRQQDINLAIRAARG